MNPLVSICIPTRDREDSLSNLVDSLARAAEKARFANFEILLVDGGTDGRIQRRFTTRKNISVFQGPGDAINARNIAADKAKGKYLAFIDDDTWTDEEYFIELQRSITVIDNVSLIKGIAGNTIRQKGESEVDKAWLAAGFDRFFDLSTRANYLRWACTSNLVVKKPDFTLTGGFRGTMIPVGGEDIDFGMRLTSQGVLLANPKLRVYHIAIAHNDIRPILRKARFYGESEQWLAELYPSYAKTDLKRYWKQLQSLFYKGNYTEQIRGAFNTGALRYSIKHKATVKTISPATMTLDIDKTIGESVSDALKKASERPRLTR